MYFMLLVSRVNAWFDFTLCPGIATCNGWLAVTSGEAVLLAVFWLIRDGRQELGGVLVFFEHQSPIEPRVTCREARGTFFGDLVVTIRKRDDQISVCAVVDHVVPRNGRVRAVVHPALDFGLWRTV